MATVAKQFPSTITGFITLGIIWLGTGFALGTLLLQGPLRLCVNYARAQQFTPRSETIIVICMILLLVVVSLFTSLKVFRWQLHGKSRWQPVAATGIPILAAGFALWYWMHPAGDTNKKQEEVGARFTIGAYPTEEKMRQLKAAGYTGVISLLHNAVVPFEPRLLQKEKDLAQQLHLQFIHAPMLPWIGDNEPSLKLIEDIVQKGQGRYYIHCYLGKDRVNMVKNLILQLKKDAVDNAPQNQRTFETQGSFERGAIYKIDSMVYLTPFPTDEEVLAFFLTGNVKTVVNLMDTSVAEAKPWIGKEKKALTGMHIQYRIIPLKEQATGKELQQVVQAIALLPKPLVVHHWNTASPLSNRLRKDYYAQTKYPAIDLATGKSVVY